MLSKVRRALTPGWILVHLVAVALVVSMVLLGRWQLVVSDRKHFSLQNFGYAIQWWLFSAFVIVLWVRILRDGLGGKQSAGAEQEPGQTEGAEVPGTEIGSRSQHAEVAPGAVQRIEYRRYVMPQSAHAPAEAEDAHQAAYNDYLSSLAESDKEHGAGRG